MGRPVVSWIEQHARCTPDRVALLDLHSGREQSYALLAQRVRALAYALQAQRGVRAGDRVAVLSRNDPRVLEVIYACALLGAIAIPLNWRLSDLELAAVLADADPAVTIVESAAGDRIPAAARTCWASEPGELDDYEGWATADVPAGWTPPPVDDDSTWLLIYTSGTTGRPRGVQLSHHAMLASLLGVIVAHQVSAASRCLTVLPLFHVAGLTLFTNPVLYLGGTAVLARGFDPAQALQQLTEPAAGITHFCGVPANYSFLEQVDGFAEVRWRPLTAVVGGSAVPVALLERWAARGVPLRAVYGITEAGACVTALPAGETPAEPGAVGPPVLYAQLRVRTGDGRAAAPGDIGELEIAGPLVTSGYWRADSADAFTADGWLRTGDAARLDATGRLVLVDRWKQMYISGGENVYPAEVENVLHAHPDVVQAAVVGVPDARWGEVGAAYLVCRAGVVPSRADVVAWCRARLAAYKVPAYVLLLDELPRNATGKVVKAALPTPTAPHDTTSPTPTPSTAPNDTDPT